MIKTRAINKDLYRNYLKKAEECFSAMESEFAKRNFNSCVLCAIHCCISAADALTIFFKGVRHAGEKHEDVIALLETLDIDRGELRNKVRQLINLLDVKNMVEYEEKLTTENGALVAIKSAERFFNWAKEMLAQ